MSVPWEKHCPQNTTSAEELPIGSKLQDFLHISTCMLHLTQRLTEILVLAQISAFSYSVYTSVPYLSISAGLQQQIPALHSLRHNELIFFSSSHSKTTPIPPAPNLKCGIRPPRCNARTPPAELRLQSGSANTKQM